LEASAARNTRDAVAKDLNKPKQPSCAIAETGTPVAAMTFDLDGWNWPGLQESNFHLGEAALETVSISSTQTDAEHTSNCARPNDEAFTMHVPREVLIATEMDVPEKEVSYALYPFITPLKIEKVPEEDLEILTLRRSFYLPAPRILNKLLMDYFKAMQPQLPILDADSFFSLINGEKPEDGYEPVSLFVLQAILPIASSVCINFNPL
jgi:hypothetical protein